MALGWIGAHAPAGTTTQDIGSTSGKPPIVSIIEIDWPDTAQLGQRTLMVGVEQVGAVTLVRDWAVVVYLPVRPPDSLVPATATAVTVRMTPEASGFPLTASRVRYGPTPVGAPARVAKVAALFNMAQMLLPGPWVSCPIMIDNGGGMTLTFTAGRGGRTVAEAEITLTGCRVLSVQVTGGGSATLGGGESTADAVIDILGLGWPHQGRS